MSSERQIAANRANAAKSTGPKTAKGKAASSRNNLRHGLFASTVVFAAGDLARFHLLLANLQADLQPESILESALIETMAVNRWRQLRLRAIEKATLPNQLRRQKLDHSASAAAPLAAAIRAVRDESRLLDIISRLDARFDRHFNAALDRLLRIREEKAVFCLIQSQFIPVFQEGRPQKRETRRAATRLHTFRPRRVRSRANGIRQPCRRVSLHTSSPPARSAIRYTPYAPGPRSEPPRAWSQA